MVDFDKYHHVNTFTKFDHVTDLFTRTSDIFSPRSSHNYNLTTLLLFFDYTSCLSFKYFNYSWINFRLSFIFCLQWMNKRKSRYILQMKNGQHIKIISNKLTLRYCVHTKKISWILFSYHYIYNMTIYWLCSLE